MSAITEQAKKSKVATKPADLTNTKELLLRAAETISNIIDSKWLWSSQVKAISLIAYMSSNSDSSKDFSGIIEKTSELLFDVMKNDEASAVGSDLVSELQKAAESLSGLPAGS